MPRQKIDCDLARERLQNLKIDTKFKSILATQRLGQTFVLFQTGKLVLRFPLLFILFQTLYEPQLFHFSGYKFCN